MISNKLGILAVLAIVPAFGQVSSDPAAGQNERIAPRQHRPIRDRAERGDGTATSSNWSGYAVTGTSFTSAEASWIVPTAKCSSGDQYAAFWVGLDGYSSSTVEQTGTDSDCVGKNPSYYAWYEFYPNPSYEITSVPVKPGDVMSAKVVYSGSQFTITITDVTTGKSYSKTASVRSAKRSSAEWIAEAPCCTSRGGILPLADFGTVLFGLDSTGVSGTGYATDSTTSGAIGIFPSASIEQITMASGSLTEAVPSGLSSDGTSFSVVWEAQ
ncbi:MAG TPA: G1 family glutamic endopeptidase [Bryobacteraceae bacterium]|nr:G1 family glutamic endopeptidase [Bryobacteraceae bacterium]